ncbi:MAG: hypothetical protein ACR2KB_05470 [Chitinophagaceae bacterium]|jgi:hypothetical protein
MNNKKEDTSVNHQHGSREEGQQNNIRPDEQQMNDTNAQPMSNMKQESEEQRAGRSENQKDEKSVQDEQRQS